MIIGTGIDIIEIKRIKRIWQTKSDTFAKYLLTSNERKQFLKSKKPEYFLAKHWAAKEALAKAIGTGISQGINFQQMEISHTPEGKPIWILQPKIYQKIPSNAQTHLSISDEKNYAIAMVVIEI